MLYTQYGKPESVPLGKEIITVVATTRVTYKRRLEEERLQKKKEEADKGNKKREEGKCGKGSTCKNRAVSLKKKKLNFKRKKKCNQEHEIGKQLMEVGTDELTQCITENNMQLISKAKLMRKTAN